MSPQAGLWLRGTLATSGADGLPAVAVAVRGNEVSRFDFFVQAGAKWRPFNVHRVAAEARATVPAICSSPYFVDAHRSRITVIAHWLHTIGVHHTDPQDLFTATGAAR